MSPRRPAPSVDLPILMYHNLTDDDTSSEYTIPVRQFAAQLEWLRDAGFTTISFRDLSDALDGIRQLPLRPVLITFDDGYDSFRSLALPALTAHGMTATVFVVAGEIGGVNRWDRARSVSQRRLMDDAAIREALAAGTEIGSHGWMHRDLTRCSDADVDEEVFRSRTELQRRFGVEVAAFAYPYGHHAERHFGRLEQAGYRAAASIFSSGRTVTHNPYAMRRVYVHAGDQGLRFRFKLSPAYLRYVAWRDRRVRESDPQ